MLASTIVIGYRPWNSATRDKMNLVDSKVGIVVGTDHFSFPSAIDECRKLNIDWVLHHPGSFDSTHGAGPWGWLSLGIDDRGDGAKQTSRELLERVQRKPVPIPLPDFSFAVPPPGIGPGDLTDRAAWKGELRAFLGSAAAYLAVFVPYHEAGLWLREGLAVRRVELDNGPSSISAVIELPCRSLSGCKPYPKTMIISPGYCRRHSFCVLDRGIGRVRWAACG